MRTKSLLVVLALTALVVVPGVGARAAEEVYCTNTHELVLSPGFSVEPSTGTYRDISGTMECHGPVDGRTPTGAGSYKDSGRYGTPDPDTCQDGGEGDGVFSSTLPTSDGEIVLSAPYRWTSGDLTSNPGSVSGEFSGEGVRGRFTLTPTKGDCVTGPITRVLVDAEFWFAESFFQR